MPKDDKLVTEHSPQSERKKREASNTPRTMQPRVPRDMVRLTQCHTIFSRCPRGKESHGHYGSHAWGLVGRQNELPEPAKVVRSESQSPGERR